MTKQEEITLISKVVLYNDHRAFTTLLENHQNGIKNLLRKLLDFNDSEMDDLFQETCLKVFKNLKQFKGNSNFSTWVYRITYNTFINSTKRKEKQRKLQEFIPLNNSKRMDIQQDMEVDMQRMIRILRPEERAAIQFSYILGFPHKEIAIIMDCPEGTVKSLIKRGRERIAKSFKNY